MATDKTRVQVITQKDRAVFEALIDQYHAPVLVYIERMVKDRSKAEDLVQESFLKLLLQQLKNRPVPDHVSAWLHRVAINLCRDYWRSADCQREKQVLDQVKEPQDGQAQVVEIYERRETRTEMITLLNELPETQREIVILRFYNELKLQEIADVMECPIGTVKSRLFHALRFLKSRMEKNGRVAYG